MRSRGRGRSSIPARSHAGSSFLDFLLLVFFFLLGLAFLRRRLRLRGQPPVGLEHVTHFFRDPFVAHEDADFATAVELELPQALAADKCGAGITDYRSDVKPQVRQLTGLDAGRPLA